MTGMLYDSHNRVMNHLREQASELLGADGVVVSLDDWIGEEASRKLRLVNQRGLDDDAVWMAFNDGRRGHYTYVGLEHYRWEVCEPSIRLVRVCVPPIPHLCDFWVVAKEDMRRFYRQYRLTQRRRDPAAAPIMDAALQQRLLDNTLGVLTRGREALDEFGVAMKRGVLLLGLPGNGKTMACRWIADQCRRRGLDWRTVSGADFDAASTPKEVRALFRLRRSGIVMFDDFDRALQDRQKFGENSAHNTFLTELDGFRPKQGIVYIFATNRQLSELDPAIRRPGRIDVVLEFCKPNTTLRRTLLEQTWQSEIVDAVGIRNIIEGTADLSFAEIEEMRTQLVFHYLDTRTWEWQTAVDRQQQRAEVLTVQRPIGFGLKSPVEDNEQPAISSEL